MDVLFRRRVPAIAVWLIGLATVSFVACTGGGDSEATPTAEPPEAAATPETPVAPPASRTPIPTATATPPPSQADAIETLVEFTVSVELHNLAILEIFSGGFQHELLSPEVEIDLELYESLIVQWEHLASIEEATLAALESLDAASVSRLPEGGSTKPIALIEPDPGGGSANGTDASATGLIDSATAFFGWVTGSSQRSRDRILTVAGSMNDAERNVLVAEWRQVYPYQTTGITSADDFMTKLRAGDLDANASRIHGQLLDVSATSVDAPRYTQLAQDEGVLLAQVAVEEGVEGLKRGAEFNVEATVAVLNAQFPGIESGREYADQADEWSEYLGDVYEDPAGGVFDAMRSQLDAQVLDPLGDQLDDSFEAATGDLSGLISSSAEQLLDFGSPSEALTAAADVGFVTLKEGTRAVIAEGEVAPAGGPALEGVDDGVPALTVAIPDPDEPVVVLPQGTYDVQSFDDDGAPIVSATIAVEAGWEKPVGPEASALPTPLLRLDEIEEEIHEAEANETGESGASATATPVPTVTKWVRVKTEVNPNNEPTEVNVEATQGRYSGTVNDWDIGETSFSHHYKSVDNDYLYWDWTFSFGWDAPPEELAPGETVSLFAFGERAGSQPGGGFPGAAFEYRADGGTIGYERAEHAVGVTGSDPSVGGGTAFDAQTYTLTAPSGSTGTFVVVALFWNLTGASVLWTYEAQQVELPPPPEPPPPTITDFLDRDGWQPAEVEHPECERFASDMFRLLCDQAPAVQEELDRLLNRNQVARLAGLQQPQNCLDFAAGPERLGCELGQAILEKDPEGCRLLFDGELETFCLVGIAGSSGRPDLVADLGDDAIFTYTATTGDFSLRDRIEDPELHDEAVAIGLIFSLSDVLSEGSKATRVPPANLCASWLRGGYTETRQADSGTTVEEAAADNRNLCEDHVMMARALHTQDPVVCDQYAAQIDAEARDWVTSGGEAAVRAAHRDQCLTVLGDVELLKQENAEP